MLVSAFAALVLNGAAYTQAPGGGEMNDAWQYGQGAHPGAAAAGPPGAQPPSGGSDAHWPGHPVVPPPNFGHEPAYLASPAPMPGNYGQPGTYYAEPAWVPPRSVHRRPGPTSLGAAVAIVLGSAFAGVAVFLIASLSVALAAVEKVSPINTGYGTYSTPSSVSREIDSYVSSAVLGSVAMIVLAVALVWSALSAFSGASSKPAIVSLGLSVVVLLITAISVHALLLLLVVLPAVGLAALLAPSNKAFCLSRAGTTF